MFDVLISLDLDVAMPGERSRPSWEHGLQPPAALAVICLSVTRIGSLTAKIVLADAADMHPPTDPPASLVPIPLKRAVLLLTQAEYLAGIRRGKWWRRRVAKERRGLNAADLHP
jgi:hypothetical protein